MSLPINDAQAEGFLLLTIPNCTVSTSTAGAQTGLLALQCVTLNVPSQATPDRDVWLVLKLDAFEMAISPTQVINFSRSTHTYMFLPEDERAGLVQLSVPPDPSNPGSYEDLETMEVILSQYGIVHDIEGPVVEKEKGPPSDLSSAPPANIAAQAHVGPSELKGRLVLMDEDDGEIVATLDDAVPIKEDKGLREFGHEKDPVVVNLPGEEEELAGHREAYVHPASPEERDMLMRTAGLISRGIVLATSAVASGMTTASNYYISHSTPTSKPVEFSPRTRANMKRIHKISGTAVTVTAKTTGAILKTLDHVAGRLGGPSSRSASGSRNASQPQLVPPPLPRRPSSPGINSGAPSNAPGMQPMDHKTPPGGYGTPPVGYGTPPVGYGTPPVGYGTPPVGYGTPSTGYGTPQRGYGTPPVGYGMLPTGHGTPPPLPQRKPRLLNRLLASTDLILTTVEHSAKELIESGTDAVSASLAHKYGQDVGNASRMTGQSARNVGLVYIDVRGVGRRALLRRAGKAVVKARMGGRDVVLGPQSQAVQPSGYPSQPHANAISPPMYAQGHGSSEKGYDISSGSFKS